MPMIAPELSVQRFANVFFAGISGYSKLLLTPDFYRRFSEYDYMLLF